MTTLLRAGEALRFVEPGMRATDHLFTGRDTVGEQRLQKFVAVNAAATPAIGGAGTAAWARTLPLRRLRGALASGATAPQRAATASPRPHRNTGHSMRAVAMRAKRRRA